jgi:hypothetical protein
MSGPTWKITAFKYPIPNMGPVDVSYAGSEEAVRKIAAGYDKRGIDYTMKEIKA